jgi:hypothetical protein
MVLKTSEVYARFPMQSARKNEGASHPHPRHSTAGIGMLASETGTLASETGTLASETGTLASETGTLASETGTLASKWQ